MGLPRAGQPATPRVPVPSISSKPTGACPSTV